MTTPDRLGAPEDLGVVELFGSSTSTFTRSIALGLHELGIPFIAIERAAHSADIKSRNPYGNLPVLVHRPDGLYTQPSDIVTLYESSAIRRYIDEFLAPIIHSKPAGVKNLTPPLKVQAGINDVKTVIERANIDGKVASFSQTLFPAVEGGVVKPGVQMKKNGADKESILVALQPGLDRVHQLLEIIEDQLEKEWSTPITWADLFLYPIADDLRNSPAADLVAGDSPAFPKIAKWIKNMDARQSVISLKS